MAFKVANSTAKVTQESTQKPTAVPDTKERVGQQEDTTLTVASVAKSESVSAASSTSPAVVARSSAAKFSVESAAASAVSSPIVVNAQSVRDIKTKTHAGSSPSAGALQQAAQQAVKAVKSAASSKPAGVDRETVLSRRGASASFTSALGASLTTTGQLPSGLANNFFSNGSSWSVSASPNASTPIVEASPDDQSYKYGLFLLKPEIITLFDSDPLYDDEQSTATNEFLSMQFATAKVTQEASYRRTRNLLSSLGYVPSIGFNESNLLPLEPVNQIERQGTSLFEQAVSKWDTDYTSTLQFCNDAVEKARAAQDIATALDIANVSGSSLGYTDLSDITRDALRDVNATPTSARGIDYSGPAGAFQTEFERHSFNRSTNGQEFISDLIGETLSLSSQYRSYALMHTLMQQSFIAFAFGSARESTASIPVSRSRELNKPESSIKFTLRSVPLGSLARKSILYKPENYYSDMSSLIAGTSSEDIVKFILLRLSGIAAFNSSNLVTSDTETALDVFRKNVGLPLGITNTEEGTGDAIADFEQASSASSANLLFQSTSTANKKVMYFDRSHNPGLPSGYVHGYSRLFGDTTSAQINASDLSSKIASAVQLHESIDKGLLASSITASGKTYKSADISLAVLQSFASLLECSWADERAQSRADSSYLTENRTQGFKKAYESYLLTAGNQTSIVKSSELKVSDTVAAAPFLASNIEINYLPADADHELLRLLALDFSPAGEDLQEWLPFFVQTLMTYWSQRFDYVVGTSTVRPTSLSTISDFFSSNLREDTRSSYTYTDVGVKEDIAATFGISTYLTAVQSYGDSSLDRIVDWSISTAKLILGSAATTGGTSGNRQNGSALPAYRSVMPVLNPSDTAAAAAGIMTGTTYDLKEICLLLTALAAQLMNALFKPLLTLSAYKTPFMGYRDEAGSTLDSIVSFVPMSFDDSRLCLGVINAQMRTLLSGLTRMTEGDLLAGGKFNQIYTPTQTASSAIRMYEFLSRRSKSPFHCPIYDETSSDRLIERSAIRSLYKTDLMRSNNTRVMFVGLPIGIQHVIGLSQRYVKITISRRDQASPEKTFNSVSFIFDGLSYISPSASNLAGSTAWTLDTRGQLNAIRDVKLFRVPESPAYTIVGPGNLQQINCSSIAVDFADAVVDTTTTVTNGITTRTTDLSAASAASRSRVEGTVSSEYLPGDVAMSDFTADVEFMDIYAVANELGIDANDVSTSSRLAGNHLVDYLLKAHVRNVAGLDMGEHVYTTSPTGFDLSLGSVDAARSYVFDLCIVDFLAEKVAGTADFDASVKHLDLLSRTPIVRSGNYADLCKSPTYFDRVFALPINIDQLYETSVTSEQPASGGSIDAGASATRPLSVSPDKFI